MKSQESFIKLKKIIVLLIIFITMLLSGCSNDKQSHAVKHVLIGPKIDRDIDSIWSIAESEPIVQIKYGNEFIKDSLDLSAKYKVLWNDSALYFLFEVYDDKKFDLNLLKYKNADIAHPWDCDCIELLFSMKNPDKKSFKPKDGDFKYEFVYSKKEVSSQFSSPTDGIIYTFKDTPTGYILEIKIPFKTLDIRPYQGLKFGFDTAVSDNDNDPSEGIFIIQRASLTWSEKGMTSEAWRNTSVIGELKLGSDVK